MKKLALGLLLTAGICGNAWASEGKTSPLQKEKKQITNILKSTNGPGPVTLATCIITTVVITRDGEGKELDRKSYDTIGYGDTCKGKDRLYYEQNVKVQGIF